MKVSGSLVVHSLPLSSSVLPHIKTESNFELSLEYCEFIEQYFQVLLFIILYKVVPTFKSVDKTLVCDHSNGSY